ncbi:hypothetical protein [Rhodococcus sp. APC 3903]|uniref:hypothetical protein n=1 Tax=Rhodococcus sp. APC 3903 TaxID=3035193 RepID=UPI0025B32A98|nr:hypothetical protein [Rhodococcus sp. APC 3903]MDN3459908.1 hypothetical protein [Rhodococcus sp. APC 3903]
MALHKVPIPLAVGAPKWWSTGAGMSIALMGDISVVERSSRLRTEYGSVGLTSDTGMSWKLPCVGGRAAVMDLLLRNEFWEVKRLYNLVQSPGL